MSQEPSEMDDIDQQITERMKRDQDIADRATVRYRQAVSLNETVSGSGTLESEIKNNELRGKALAEMDFDLARGDGEVKIFPMASGTRDRMIVWCREDIAITNEHARSAFRAAYRAKTLSRFTLVVVVALLIVNLVILVKLS